MRDLFLALAVLVGLVATLRRPFAGILLWTWFACMVPHMEAFGFVRTQPINLIIVLVTLLAWLFSKERKIPPLDAAFFLLLSFLAWITLNEILAVKPDWSWPIYNNTWKTITLGLFVAASATNKVRAHALVWAVVVSLFYYSIKGGLFTILTGGNSHVLGPANSPIGDNNTLALATLMILPLANYLRLHSANRWISRGLLAGIALSTVSVLGSYSRGGFVGLGGLGVIAWFRSRKKFIYPIVAGVVIVSALSVMPQGYFDRLNTIATANEDSSFHGRLVAWQVAWRYASEHFPFGNGMRGSELPSIFNHYFPREETHAAHSIFFEVLGDNGFVGLGLYLAILLLTFLSCVRIRKTTRGNPELAWAFDLAGMIQLSLFVFCLAGSALSMAYYDVLFVCVGLTSALRGMLRNITSTQAEVWRTVRLPTPIGPQTPVKAARGG